MSRSKNLKEAVGNPQVEKEEISLDSKKETGKAEEPTFKITKEGVNRLASLAQEMPTKYGMPLLDVLNNTLRKE